MSGYIFICAFTAIFLSIIFSTCKHNKKQDRLLSIRKKVISFYCLGGFYYEYKTVKFGYFYSNSYERLSREWQVATTFKDGSYNEMINNRGYNAISFSNQEP